MILRLDPNIRNWVFIPITLITLFINLLMKYLNHFLHNTTPKPNPSKTLKESIDNFNIISELKSRDDDIKVKSAINRANKFKVNYMNISERGYKARKAFFCREGEGFFNQTFKGKEGEMMNPNLMFDMIKKNAVNGIYFAFIFVGVGYLFSGFILLKMPFGLTQKFRSMLQQGLNLPDLDLSYVSAISWCFILVFGLNSILQHFDGHDNHSFMKEQEQLMKNNMSMMAPPMGPQSVDYGPICSAEKENIEIITHYTVLDDSVDRLLDKYAYLIKN